MKKGVKITVSISLYILIVVGIIIAGYFVFINSKTCSDETCFSESLIKCKRTIFIKDEADTVTQYRILGKSRGTCEVEVKLLQIKRGSSDLVILENKEMICNTPLGADVDPESNIQACHGLLKESIQEVMIQRMHSQLVENIGEINTRFYN